MSRIPILIALSLGVALMALLLIIGLSDTRLVNAQGGICPNCTPVASSTHTATATATLTGGCTPGAVNCVSLYLPYIIRQLLPLAGTLTPTTAAPATATRGSSQTPAPTQAASATPQGGPSATATPTPFDGVTSTPPPFVTETGTATPTPFGEPTHTPTPFDTETGTFTPTPAMSITGTATPTPFSPPTPSGPSLLVFKQAQPSQPTPGGTVTYLIVAMNDMLGGLDPGAAVTVYDPVPAGLTVLTDTLSSGATYDMAANAVTWQGSVPQGQSVGVTFQARVALEAAGSLINTATITDALGMVYVRTAQVLVATETTTPTPTPFDPGATATATPTPLDVGGTPTPTPACQTHTASMSISLSDTTIQVGDVFTATVTLHNPGCVALGLPQYRLTVDPAAESPLDPVAPEPITHYLAVAPGQSDSARFVLRAVRPGSVTLNARASFEVHLGYPGPAYWSGDSAPPLALTVSP